MTPEEYLQECEIGDEHMEDDGSKWGFMGTYSVPTELGLRQKRTYWAYPGKQCSPVPPGYREVTLTRKGVQARGRFD